MVPDAPDTRPLPQRITSAFPPAVWAVAGTFLALLLAYSVLFPAYRGPDEPLHVDLMQRVSEDFRYPAWDEGRIDGGIRGSLNEAGFHDRPLRFEEDDAVPRGRRPSFADIRETIAPGARNQLPQHPPLHYAVAGLTDRVVDQALPGDPFGSWDLQAWFYRLVSAALVAPLPLVIWRVATLLELPEGVGLAATLVPFAIPELLHIGSVANNDDLLMLLAWLLTPVVLRLALGTVAPRTAALAGAITGLALLTKGLALVLPAVVTVALLVGWWRAGRPHARLALAAATYAATAVAAGGWWWIRNLVVYGQIAPSIEYDRFTRQPGVDAGISRFLQQWAYHTNRRFWGDFGWLELSIPLGAVTAATVVAVVALVLALRPRPFGVTAGPKLVLLAPLLALAAFTAANAYSLYARSGAKPMMQGRYWFGGLAGAAVLVAIGLAAPFGRRHARFLPPLVLAAAAAMQVVAVHTALDFYWARPGSSTGQRLAALVAWSPLPSAVLAGGAMIGTVITTTTVVAIVRRAIARTAPAPEVEPAFTFTPAGAAPT